jgi:rfaE bifunctional protein nucleotidyltransferase chain/domain
MKTDSKILTYQGLSKKAAILRRKKKKIVVATGTFDLFHLGHLLFLSFAKRQGDILVVGVGSDRIIKEYKGNHRPILNERLRTRLIAGFETVDFVVLLDENPVEKITGQKFFRLLKPDIWVVPYKDHNPAGIQRFAKEIKAHLVRFPRIGIRLAGEPLSTTAIIARTTRVQKGIAAGMNPTGKPRRRP